MREWNSYSDDLTIDGNVVKEYTIRFKTTEYEVYKRIENFFQRLMDEPHTMDKCYKCRWWNYAYGCQNKKGICQFEAMADRKTEPSNSEIPNNFDKDINVRSKDEPQSDARKFLGCACETCKHRDEEWDSEACDGCCENDDHYEPQTERSE